MTTKENCKHIQTSKLPQKKYKEREAHGPHRSPEKTV